MENARLERLKKIKLPDYTKGEEIFNMVTHIVGGGLGVVVLVLCVIFSALHRDAWAVVGCSVYGASMIALYTISSVYHGLSPEHARAKKVMQVIDHCTIYFLIAGTYTPIVLAGIRRIDPVAGWVLFGVVWGLAALATALTAIDLRKYRVFSMICYIGMGWCIVLTVKPLLAAMEPGGLILLLAGGVCYTVGIIFYKLKKIRYMHSIWHLFVLAGSILHYFSVYFYVL